MKWDLHSFLLWYTVKWYITGNVRPKYDFHKSVSFMVSGLTCLMFNGIKCICVPLIFQDKFQANIDHLFFLFYPLCQYLHLSQLYLKSIYLPLAYLYYISFYHLSIFTVFTGPHNNSSRPNKSSMHKTNFPTKWHLVSYWSTGHSIIFEGTYNL